MIHEWPVTLQRMLQLARVHNLTVHSSCLVKTLAPKTRLSACLANASYTQVFDEAHHCTGICTRLVRLQRAICLAKQPLAMGCSPAHVNTMIHSAYTSICPLCKTLAELLVQQCWVSSLW